MLANWWWKYVYICSKGNKMSERMVEIPYVLSQIQDGKVLDVGMDRVGYLSKLIEIGCTVLTVDPVRDDADYKCKFQNLPDTLKFDYILFLSTIEHFDASEENYKSCQVEIETLKKCKRMLRFDGKVIITVPYGRHQILNNDCILWGRERIKKIFDSSDVIIIDECWYKNTNPLYEDAWENCKQEDVDNCYYNNGEFGFAQAVYMCTLKFN
jgi:hypothetical protein